MANDALSNQTHFVPISNVKRGDVIRFDTASPWMDHLVVSNDGKQVDLVRPYACLFSSGDRVYLATEPYSVPANDRRVRILGNTAYNY